MPEDPFQTSPPEEKSLSPTVDEAPKTSDSIETNPTPTGRLHESGHPPERIGRYRITDTLGAGGFGCVYLGHDDDLNRPVAIKVPHRERISSPKDIESYLAEARILASLDHPNIVPVHDVGRTEDGLCFVVSKFIEGSDLANRMKKDRPPFSAAAKLVAITAEALHYAHRQGLVHRDVKPANILIDNHDKPFVVDFGLAMKEQDFGKGSKLAGTPAYMSPEQARKEGHRVDGRSDIFSLSVVFYELLTGKRPFLGDSITELLEHISNVEARPPRQHDDAIPKELERICLKALSKRASDRYTTAKDMADDLQHFLSVGEAAVPRAPVTTEPDRVMIVPKGLRSFDANDASFFLELLPGPRDRDGLPESIHFWKRKIEETDPDETFTVCLIYGPSGSGKSSLVKAGLLPRLASHVVPIYIEATAKETESRILKGLRKHWPGLPPDVSLVDAIASLRRSSGRKVLLVLDQFEQWLHAQKGVENSELVQALRQCDGEHVQCVVMVRDDFWLAVSRFMKELEIEIIPGQNSALVDLFDLLHARKVLASFGRAFGRLSDILSKEQGQFLEESVSGLAQDGKVISVRLALFAEMVKGKPWTTATLKEIGGTEGVGVTFLEETFSSRTAHPKHKLHQQAARAVLKALLPEQGSDIKGSMLSMRELRERSGYQPQPKDFEELLRILDSELRLITPTESEGEAGEFYQLTHDYLVPSLRDWLTRKQRETWRGRAALRLAGLTAQWVAFPAKRQLPTSLEWLNIELFTTHSLWSASERRMMKSARRYHTIRGSLMIGLLLAFTFLGLVIQSRVIAEQNATHARGLVEALRKASTDQVPAIVKQMDGYREWSDPLLREELGTTPADSRQHLHASLALLPVDEGQVDYLYQRTLAAAPNELTIIRDSFKEHGGSLRDRLWKKLNDENADSGQRFRAACVLATYDTENENWPGVSSFVLDQLLVTVQQNPSHYAPLLDMLRPIREELLKPLPKVFRNQERSESDRSLSTNILADYASDRPDVLTDVLLDADEKPFAVLFPKVEAHRDHALATLEKVVGASLDDQKSNDKKEELAKRQANAHVALLRLGQPEKVWPVLRHSPDPRARSYLIHRLSPLGADPQAIVSRLDKENDVSVRRALILALGEFDQARLPTAELTPKLLDWYRNDPDPGIHGATDWLLRRWKQHDKLKEIDDHLSTGKVQANRRWYVNGEGQTMVVIPGPVEFLMGSPPTEEGREGGAEGKMETQHQRRIGRTFAVASKEVTVKQFLSFREKHNQHKQYAPTEDCPVNVVTWYDAAAYCNWLSDVEGLPKDQWCYEPNAQGQYAEGMKARPNYLSLQGYRLPSEAEWEYACRAGAITSGYYGETEELLGKYAWYIKNSLDRWMVPVGSLKPNDLGLFDVQGNAFEWCHDQILSYPTGGEVVEDREINGDILDRNRRVVRGGSFTNRPVAVRSAGTRVRQQPTYGNVDIGFRVVRTMPSK